MNFNYLYYASLLQKNENYYMRWKIVFNEIRIFFTARFQRSSQAYNT